MSAREFLWIVKESSLNTPMASPVAGTDSLYIRLTDGNAFGMVAKPIIEKIPYGGGVATQADAVSDHYECQGGLKTKLYPAQAALLLAWACTPINAGQTLPWTTTEAPTDLASCSVYHAVMRADGTYRRKQYSGVKVASGAIEVSRQSTTAALSLGLVACKCVGNAMEGTTDPTSTVFPAPQETDYPVGPYTFHHTSGNLTIGSARTQYRSLALNFQNKLSGNFFEGQSLGALRFCGRESTLAADLYLKATPDDRSAYEALTAQTVSLTFNNGTHTAVINYGAKNLITDLPYDLPLDQAYFLRMTLANLWDAGAGQDIALSFT